MPWVFTSGVMGDKHKLSPDRMYCTWTAYCPSHKPFHRAKKPKMKFIERVQPHVCLWECKYCGMRSLLDSSGENMERGFEKNQALIGGDIKI